MARSNPRQKSAEIVVAALFFLAGAIVVFDSVRLGARWAEDGPQAGYFPFYIGLLVCISAALNLVMALVNREDAERDFVELDKLKLVLAVLIPTAIYVAVISWTGIYVASTLFIAFFMRWLGKYPWWKVAAVSIGTMVAFFLIFESWFKVPLPKGPLENLLGVG
ncbi:MAG TPA: tripartite tricarboxylate transporter TctB family protein [Burkholderiales bacterium]|nr:tripartite tricarboxylate transporter TctB family protein [Burkholderiales bacterium]